MSLKPAAGHIEQPNETDVIICEQQLPWAVPRLGSITEWPWRQLRWSAINTLDISRFHALNGIFQELSPLLQKPSNPVGDLNPWYERSEYASIYTVIKFLTWPFLAGNIPWLSARRTSILRNLKFLVLSPVRDLAVYARTHCCLSPEPRMSSLNYPKRRLRQMRKPIQAVDVLGLNQAGFYDLRHYGYDASSPSPASIHKWCLAGLLLIGSFSLFASPASAGLFFCNNSGQEISVAIGWSQDNKWVSKGWFTVNPGQCDATLLGMLTNRVYYYYAESEGRTLTWGGHGENDAGYFCTSQDAFYLDSSSNDCEGHNFKRLWVGEEHQFTVTLTERRTDPTSAAYNCRSSMEDGMDSFAKCWTREIATGKQRRILDCIDRMNSKASLALCASKDYLSMDLYDVASCANKYNETREGDQFLTCVSKGRLSEQEQKVFNCALKIEETLAVLVVVLPSGS